jgi:hypothetical protein
VGDGCVFTNGGSCASSLNFPNAYGSGENCTLTNVPATPLSVLGFRLSYTWSDPPYDDCIYDYLVVNGKKYCGTSGPDGVASDGTIIWTAKSDSWCANEGSCEGWQLCWECPPCTESARQVLFAPYVAPAAHATAAAFDECCFD